MSFYQAVKPVLAFVMLTYYPNVKVVRNNLRKFSDIPGVLVDNTPDYDAAKSIPQDMGSKHLEIIHTGRNTGYARGMNIGIQFLLKSGFEWILILNDDITVPEHIGTVVSKSLAAVRPGIAGPFAGLLDHNRWTTIFSSDTDVTNGKPDYISGSFMAVHADVFRNVGFFHEPYFIYYEDVDLNVRTQKKGFVLTRLPIHGVKHAESVTLGSGSFFHQYYNARNHLYFVERNAPLRVKLYEACRFPKTLHEHIEKNQKGSLDGIQDYFYRRFGSTGRQP